MKQQMIQDPKQQKNTWNTALLRFVFLPNLVVFLA